ncbi:MAG: hypothetical protein RBR86_05340 [Pseudobdellovibrionaceae bacterium]|jgi:hypothetical protein|nr:hypothetical protein [Pseudobdellovibrionaceae bacterium]
MKIPPDLFLQAKYFAETEQFMRGFYTHDLLSCASNVIAACITGTDQTGSVFLRTPVTGTYEQTSAVARTIKVGMEIIGGLQTSERFANSNIVKDIGLQAVKHETPGYFSLTDFFAEPAKSDQIEFIISRSEIDKAVTRQDGVPNIIVDMIKSISFQAKPPAEPQKENTHAHPKIDIVLE